MVQLCENYLEPGFMATNLAPKMLRQVSFQEIDLTLNSELQVSLDYRVRLC